MSSVRWHISCVKHIVVRTMYRVGGKSWLFRSNYQISIFDRHPRKAVCENVGIENTRKLVQKEPIYNGYTFSKNIQKLSNTLFIFNIFVFLNGRLYYFQILPEVLRWCTNIIPRRRKMSILIGTVLKTILWSLDYLTLLSWRLYLVIFLLYLSHHNSNNL